MKRLKTVVVGVLAVGVLTGCSQATPASDEIAVHKGGGPIEGKGSKGCVEPDTREFTAIFDDFFYYPLNQRIFDFTGDDSSDAQPIQVVSKDDQILTIPGTVNFDLNTDCDVLTAFHDNIGRTRGAYMVEGENGQLVLSDGWTKTLNLYIGRAADATLDRVAKDYTWRELYSDPAIKDKMNAAVNETIQKLVDQQTDGDQQFFRNFSALIQQPRPADELIAALKQEETARAEASATEAKAVADAAAAEAAADAQVAQKEAELAVRRIEAQLKQTEIAPYGNAQEFNYNKAIEKGLNPYQPTYGNAIVAPQ